jgi:hypothetical protein
MLVDPHTTIDWLSTITGRVVSWDEEPKDNYQSIEVFNFMCEDGYPGRIFNIAQWANVMNKSNSCLVAAKNEDKDATYSKRDVGYGILALLRYPFQLFLSLQDSEIEKVTKTGNEYATIVFADKRPCFYMPSPPADLPTALALSCAPLLVPKSKLTHIKLPAYVTVTDVKQVVTLACEFPGARNGTTPALSGEYEHFYAFKEKDITYIAPQVKAENVVMLTTPYSSSINLGSLGALPDFDVKTKVAIGSYATTGYRGTHK